MKKIFISLILITLSVFSVNSAVQNTTKLCALTFDDGPDTRLTPRILDRLEKYGVPATFFVVGFRINDSTKSVIDRALSLGCEYGNHSWDYNPLDKADPKEIADKIARTNEVIEKYTGKKPLFFRPPNLAVSKTMFDVIDMPFISGVIGFDWAGCDRTPENIANNVLKGVRDGAIILLHDVQPEPHPTPEALDIIIPELKKQGYEFVTLSELFKRKSVDPKDPKYKNKLWVYVEP